MKRRHRIYFTEKQKADIWDRWERGESMSPFGRLFEPKPAQTISVSRIAFHRRRTFDLPDR